MKRFFVLSLILFSTSLAASKTTLVDGVRISEVGDMFTASSRFRIEGKVFDTWTGQYISDVRNLPRISSTIPVDHLPFKLADQTPFIIGTGPLKNYVFVDPACNACKELLSILPSSTDYSFYIYFVSFVSTESSYFVDALACAERSNETLLRIRHSSYDGLKVMPVKTCPKEFTSLPSKWMSLASIFNFNQVPFLIRHDGLVRTGVPSSLSDWLRSN